MPGSSGDRVFACIGAALFVVIKPPFAVLALALPALVSCVRGRSLRCLFTSENMLGAALTLAYLMWLAAFHRAFLMGPLPMILELYLPMRMPVVESLLSGPVLLLGMVTVATWATARPGSMHRIAILLLLAAWGDPPTFVMLGKGWGYQALPFLTFGLLAFVLQLRIPDFNLGTSHVLDLVWGRGRAGVFLLLPSAVHPLHQVERRAELALAAAAIERIVERPTVGSIAARLQSAHPLTLMIGGDFKMRYPSLWVADNADALIKAAGTNKAKVEQIKGRRDGVIRQAAEDVERERPAILFDAGSAGTPGQPAIHDSPDIARALADYRVLYQDEDRTILLRSGSRPGTRPLVLKSAR